MIRSNELTRPETVRFEFRRYLSEPYVFENDLVAKLPGLLISQFAVPDRRDPSFASDSVALRFDFIDDWYCVLAFLDEDGSPTGHYHVCIQSPLQNDGGIWHGDDLIMGLEITPDFAYSIVGEEEFFSAVEDGWMRVYSAAKGREALRSLCVMVDGGCLPQEVMDAVHG